MVLQAYEPDQDRKLLILACADQRILARWNQALTDYQRIAAVNNFLSLKVLLRREPQATVIVHGSLSGLASQQEIIRLANEFANSGIMVLEDIPEQRRGISLVSGGILGYGNTHMKADLLREAVRMIELGEIWVSKRLLRWMVNHCSELDSIDTDPGSWLALDTLTNSERRVAECLAGGGSNKQIARCLKITERTVKAHLTSIYQKIGVSDRLHLALLLHENETPECRAECNA